MNPPIIRKLDEITINRIAAGEVVQSPAAAIKEMVENSLDAGSTSVTVVAKGGGLNFLQIIDNGHGIRKEDLAIVCERFTTSKISCYDDLQKVVTFGFRGEALASITHVAHVQIVTRTTDSPCAYKAKYSDGKLTPIKVGDTCDPKPCAGTVGTTICVEDLFYNMPTRRNAFKNQNEQYQKILDILTKYAIHYGDKKISLTCKKFGQTSPDLYTSNSASTLDNIKSIYGAATGKELLKFEINNKKLTSNTASNGDHNSSSNDGVFSCTGYISNANYSSKKSVYIFFINNRLVECPSVKKCIDLVYSSILPKHSHPFIYLSFQMPSENIDVNVHPTKKEVHFLYEDRLLEILHDELQIRLENANESRVFYTQSVLFNSGFTSQLQRPSQPPSRPSLLLMGEGQQGPNMGNESYFPSPVAERDEDESSSADFSQKSTQNDPPSRGYGGEGGMGVGEGRWRMTVDGGGALEEMEVVRKRSRETNGSEVNSYDGSSGLENLNHSKDELFSMVRREGEGEIGATSAVRRESEGMKSVSMTTIGKKAAPSSAPANRLVRVDASTASIHSFFRPATATDKTSTSRFPQSANGGTEEVCVCLPVTSFGGNQLYSTAPSVPSSCVCCNRSAQASRLAVGANMGLSVETETDMDDHSERSEVADGAVEGASGGTVEGEGEGFSRKRQKRPAVLRLEEISSHRNGSVRALVERLLSRRHDGVEKILRRHLLVGVVDDAYLLVQFETQLLLLDHSLFTREMFYQISLGRCSSHSSFKLFPPLSLSPLLETALSHPVYLAEWSCLLVDQNRPLEMESLLRKMTKILADRHEFLAEYFSIRIDPDTLHLLSLPELIPDYIPDLAGLPMFLVHIAIDVEWENEMKCLDDIAQELADYYGQLPSSNMKSSGEGKEVKAREGEAESLREKVPVQPPSEKSLSSGVETNIPTKENASEFQLSAEATVLLKDVLWPAVKLYLVPPQDFVENGAVIRVAELDQLYKVFERC